MKILDNTIQDYTGTNFSVYKREEGETIIKYNTSGDIIENNEMYSKVMLGKCETCNPFYKNSFEGFTYDKVFILGSNLLFSNSQSSLDISCAYHIVSIIIKSYVSVVV